MFKNLKEFSSEVNYEIEFNKLIIEFLKLSRSIKRKKRDIILLRIYKIKKSFNINIIIK